MGDLEISMKDVEGARQVLSDVIRSTPLGLALDKSLSQNQIHFKYENFQLTGSFKIRGALNKIASLNEEEKKRGVIAASAGNHAQGVAYSAEKHQVACHIVMPQAAPLIKVSATKSYGAKVTLHGNHFGDAFDKAQEMAEQEGYVFVHPYQDPLVIAGQATIGLEILEALPDVKSVVVPIGGGGLIGGISYVIKQKNPKCKVYGVVLDQTPGMMELKKEKSITKNHNISTIADGIAVKTPSPVMFKNYIDNYVDDIVSVSDEEIAQAIVQLMEIEKVIVEGSGAAGLAALLNERLKLETPSCLLLCGGNIDLNTVNSVIDTGLRKHGRLTRISVIVSDLPGALALLTQELADCRANVLDVTHDRVCPELTVRQTRIDFLLETLSFEHIEEIKQRLRARGVRIVQEILVKEKGYASLT